MENLFQGDTFNIIIMVIVGAIAGSLAARVIRGDNFGFIINAILGIAGAVVGGHIFNWLGVSPGSGIVRVIDETFGVSLPQNLVGMIVSATVGAVVILWVMSIFRGRKRSR
ncbi:MAG: GlsB/YeaQ/YmgE family stress response membrane protein [Bacteroidota bacterium]